MEFLDNLLTQLKGIFGSDSQDNPAPDNSAPPVNSGADFLSKAESQYPFLKQYSPSLKFTNEPGSGQYSETWPPGEPGSADYRWRPPEFPMGALGVEVFRPDHFGASDLAGEAMHYDNRARQASELLFQSMSPGQIDTLKGTALDYQGNEPEQRKLQNATDAALRGYVVGQWPQTANDSMNYDEYQRNLMDMLKRYIETGRSW